MKGQDQRTVLYLMAFATTIALVGHTAEVNSPKTVTAKLNPALGDAQILLGGVAATVILVLLSEAGQPGAIFAKGISVVALLSSLGFYATPVFEGLAKVTGQATATTAIAPTTKPVAKPKTGATK